MSLLWRLVADDLKTLLGKWHHSLFAVALNSLVFVFVNGYMLPLLGIFAGFGGFMMAAYLIQIAMFETINNATGIINELRNTRRLQYELTLPLDARLVFLKTGIVLAANNAILFAWVLPLSKLFLGAHFDFTHINYSLVLVMYLIINLFWGFTGLWLIALCQTSTRLAVIRIGLISPLWIFGCYSFPYRLLNQHFPFLAKLDLLNPFTYAHEGLRAALFGAESFLPIWLCISVLLFLSAILAVHALYRFKRRFDYI